MWQPISLTELEAVIREDLASAPSPELRLWEQIRIVPEKWRQQPWGDRGGGFWAVAVIGKRVVWYNDIEHGFDISSYSVYGYIVGYLCSQLELHHVTRRIYEDICLTDA